MIQQLLRESVALVPWQWRTAIKQIPLVAPAQRWLLTRFLDGCEFVHTVDAGPARGFRCPVILPQDKGIWVGTYELQFATHLSQAVHPEDVCLDIGGWRGFFSGVMGLAGASKVYVFEPLPANIAHIEKVIELNPELHIEVIPMALSDCESVSEFCVMPSSCMGKLASSTFQKDERGLERIHVKTVTLDQWMASTQVTPPAVIKIDVEGAELEVLRGGLNLLSGHHPRLFIEAHSRPLAAASARLLERLGYHVIVEETGRKLDGISEPEVCHLTSSFNAGS